MSVLSSLLWLYVYKVCNFRNDLRLSLNLANSAPFCPVRGMLITGWWVAALHLQPPSFRNLIQPHYGFIGYGIKSTSSSRQGSSSVAHLIYVVHKVELFLLQLVRCS